MTSREYLNDALWKGVITMEEDNIKKSESLKKAKPKKDEEKLQPCDTAPSAEHARAHSEDEPCDDGRTGWAGYSIFY